MDPEILIIGAGATGLALAQGLRQAGIPSVVFERHDGLSTRERDWNMGFHWGVPALRSLLGEESWGKVDSTVTVDPNVPTKPLDSLHFLNGLTGETMSSVDIPYFYRLRRGALRELLSDGVDIQFGKKLANIDYSNDGKSVTAWFEDGSSATGSLIVGADGSHSTVRRLLLGPHLECDVRRLPYAASSAQAKFTREQALFLRSFHPLYLAGIHPHNKFGFFGMQYAPEVDHPESWTFFFYVSWPYSLEEQNKTANWTNDQRLAQVKDFAKDFSEPWKSAFAWLPESHPVWYIEFSDWDPAAEEHQWDNHGGRVTLAGDAAHTMTFQRGQGLNHSMSDSAKILEAFKTTKDGSGTSLATAIAGYEEEMIARSGEEVRQSTINSVMVHDWSQVLESPVLTKGLKKG